MTSASPSQAGPDPHGGSGPVRHFNFHHILWQTFLPRVSINAPPTNIMLAAPPSPTQAIRMQPKLKCRIGPDPLST